MADKPHKKPGPKSRFNQRIAEKVLRLASEGKTDVEISEAIGIAPCTLYMWKGRYEGFAEAIKACKNVADALVEAALFRRATGYSHPAVKIIFDKDAGIVTEGYTEHYPPDTTACIFWLKNRRPKQWRDAQKVEHEGALTLETLVAGSMKKDEEIKE